LRDLVHLEKDRKENVITGQFIQRAFERLVEKGELEMNMHSGSEGDFGIFNTYVKALREGL